MSPAELTGVDQAVSAFQRVMKVGCTGCQYCLPCPFGVDIPRCFDLYSSKHAFRDKSAGLFYLGLLGGYQTGRSAMASDCKDCGACLDKCPQSLAIPELLREVAADMELAWSGTVLKLARRLLTFRHRKN